MKNSEFNTELDCKKYLLDNNLKSKRFYFNIFGWDTYFTLDPTFATPSGKLKGFPNSKIIKL